MEENNENAAPVAVRVDVEFEDATLAAALGCPVGEGYGCAVDEPPAPEAAIHWREPHAAPALPPELAPRWPREPVPSVADVFPSRSEKARTVDCRALALRFAHVAGWLYSPITREFARLVGETRPELQPRNVREAEQAIYWFYLGAAASAGVEPGIAGDPFERVVTPARRAFERLPWPTIQREEENEAVAWIVDHVEAFDAVQFGGMTLGNRGARISYAVLRAFWLAEHSQHQAWPESDLSRLLHDGVRLAYSEAEAHRWRFGAGGFRRGWRGLRWRHAEIAALERMEGEKSLSPNAPGSSAAELDPSTVQAVADALSPEDAATRRCLNARASLRAQGGSTWANRV